MNLTALSNITPFEVNNTLLNNTEDIAINIVNNANDTTGGYFGLVMMSAIFFVLLVIAMTEQDVFRFDFISSLAFSSGVTLLVGITAVIGGVITSFQHVMWFAMILMVAAIAKYLQKSQ
jgi:hypothetical protein